MNTLGFRLRARFALLLAVLGVTACNPEGPGASGEVSLGSGVEPAGFQFFNIVATPADAQSPFNPAAPSFPSASISAASEAPFPVQDPLAGMTFPSPYKTGQSLGTSSQSNWEIFIWFSKSAGEAAPTSGEPYGVTAFTVSGCGLAGGFCGVTAGVDVTLDQTAP
jgi:hypothetical protein